MIMPMWLVLIFAVAMFVTTCLIVWEVANE